jgi:uncharacterized phage-like protein YoqJ
MDIAARLDKLLEELCCKGYSVFCTGGAAGFDTEAALAVLRMREKDCRIKLNLVLPYPKQAAKWSLEKQSKYEEIKRLADSVVYTGQSYSRGCFHIRNRALVDGAGLCVAYLGSSGGGTAYTVGYARRQGIEVVNLFECEGGTGKADA